MNSPCLLLVDGHAYAYRAFHAIRELRGPNGEATNAVFGFVKMLRKMLDKLRPSHAAVVWDGGLAPFRQSLWPAYKAQRPPMPESLDQQIGQIQSYLDGEAIKSDCRPDVEADDLIASYVFAGREPGVRVVVASSDKDFMQLVDERVGLLNPNDKSERIWTDTEVRAKTGVEPGQVVDWLSLIGDSVDNIPGVPGIGPKTATALLSRFGSIHALYANLNQITPERLRQPLADARDAVERNLKMIRLDASIGVEIESTRLNARPANLEFLAEFFDRCGFRTLRRELDARRTGQPELF